MKPNCLIIDEIDGAPAVTNADTVSLWSLLFVDAIYLRGFQNSIQILIDFITGNYKSKKKGAAKDNGVSRPIICICNDL